MGPWPVSQIPLPPWPATAELSVRSLVTEVAGASRDEPGGDLVVLQSDGDRPPIVFAHYWVSCGFDYRVVAQRFVDILKDKLGIS